MNLDGKPLTAKQREHHHYLIDAMARIDYDLHNRIMIHHRVPHDWVRIATSPSPAKKRVTIRVDEDVLKFFRSMGPDYGPRMNDVLKAFMRARLMGLLHGDETIDQFKEQEKSGPRKRPKWGWTDQMMEEGDAWLKTRRGEE
ncbi:BrnA antitoxin family protein [Nioella sp. MMSF_3534]|uniref:BrnA antitoxin family protein n=1 Tax=Nioella sp. MMSF_3534 TaxID=3046720 RepID=UPI00273D464E|nr:BrnA antitoxin family protein [Nioella sp. MMSF_3534]